MKIDSTPQELCKNASSDRSKIGKEIDYDLPYKGGTVRLKKCINMDTNYMAFVQYKVLRQLQNYLNACCLINVKNNGCYI